MNYFLAYRPKFTSPNIGGYRYFFNGQEGDNEMFGEVANFGYEFRQYDSRLGRWWSVDRMCDSYVSHSPYCYSLDSPLSISDDNGKWVRDQNGNIIICYSRRLNRKNFKSYSLSNYLPDGRLDSYSVEGNWGYIMANNGKKVAVFIPNQHTVQHTIYNTDGSIYKAESLSENFDPSKNCTTNSLLPDIPNIIIGSEQISEDILLSEGYVKGDFIDECIHNSTLSGDPAAVYMTAGLLTQKGDIVTYQSNDGVFVHFELFLSANTVDTKGGFEKGPIYAQPMSNELFGNNSMIWFNTNVKGWQDVIKYIMPEYSTGTATGLNFVNEKYFNKLRDEIRQ
jgi:RHS repeat-associated protein